MLRTATAPDVTETVTDAIRGHRKYLNDNHGSRYITFYYTTKEAAGRFSAVAEAVVEVELHIKFSQRANWRSEENTVQFVGFAWCTGHGCIDPKHETLATEEFLLDADADETAPAALPLVAAARAWAQKHAETCRALPYNGR